jgi:hypothetical protein
MGLYGLDWCRSGSGKVEGSCECFNELSGSLKFCDALEWLHN